MARRRRSGYSCGGKSCSAADRRPSIHLADADRQQRELAPRSGLGRALETPFLVAEETSRPAIPANASTTKWRTRGLRTPRRRRQMHRGRWAKHNRPGGVWCASDNCARGLLFERTTHFSAPVLILRALEVPSPDPRGDEARGKVANVEAAECYGRGGLGVAPRHSRVRHIAADSPPSGDRRSAEQSPSRPGDRYRTLGLCIRVFAPSSRFRMDDGLPVPELSSRKRSVLVTRGPVTQPGCVHMARCG